MSDENMNGAASAAPEGPEGRRPGDPYEVGFARPPKATRFKKGQSGNPKGRPKASEVVDVHGALQKVLARRIRVTVANEIRHVTIRQALLLKLRDLAAAGDPAMHKRFVRVIENLPKGAIQPGIDMAETNMKLRLALGLTAPEDVR